MTSKTVSLLWYNNYLTAAFLVLESIEYVLRVHIELIIYAYSP